METKSECNLQALPVVFSGSPPTKIVRQPGGLSRVVGGGALGLGGNSVHDLQWIISFTIGVANMLGSDGITVPSGPTMLPSGIIPPIIPYCKSISMSLNSYDSTAVIMRLKRCTIWSTLMFQRCGSCHIKCMCTIGIDISRAT
jgi:hypothetical protein